MSKGVLGQLLPPRCYVPHHLHWKIKPNHCPHGTTMAFKTNSTSNNPGQSSPGFLRTTDLWNKPDSSGPTPVTHGELILVGELSGYLCQKAMWNLILEYPIVFLGPCGQIVRFRIITTVKCDFNDHVQSIEIMSCRSMCFCYV